jgi:hypothetical protein
MKKVEMSEACRSMAMMQSKGKGKLALVFAFN